MSRRALPVPQYQLDEKHEAELAGQPYTATYKVTGHKRVKGKKHGETVELTMTSDQLDVLVGAGLIAPVGDDDEDHPAHVEEEAVLDETATEERK